MFFSFLIAFLIIIVSISYYIWFSGYEGKDERGRKILAKSSQIAFIFILFGFVFQSFYFQFGNPTVEKVQMMISIWMALVFASNSVSIVLYRKTL
ncbi:hypothetical protein [Lentibacillus juripiscarius]|uniref:DUF2178 domain-containing protein n=1 Tax=Lentibacillus juripiscarius TaxID=257446 RepID=A0ABW5V6F7_9BACI